MMPNIKLQWSIASGLLLLGLMIGGHWLYGQYAVEKPLVQELSRKIPITRWEMEKVQGKERIILGLGPVDDLQQAVGDVREGVRRFGGTYLLQLQDKPSPELVELWQVLHLSVYEGLSKGNFAELDDKVREEAAKRGAQGRISVDEDYLYVQLRQGDGYLYRVLARNKAQVPNGWLLMSGEVDGLD